METLPEWLRQTDEWSRRLDTGINGVVNGVLGAVNGGNSNSNNNNDGDESNDNNGEESNSNGEDSNSNEEESNSGGESNNGGGTGGAATTTITTTTTNTSNSNSPSATTSTTTTTIRVSNSGSVNSNGSGSSGENYEGDDGDSNYNADEGDEGGHNLSAGAIVGITLACVAFFLGIAGLLFWMYRRRRRREREERGSHGYANKSQGKKDVVRANLDTPTTANASTGNFASMRENFDATDSLQMSTLGRAQGGLWQDESIQTVRIPFEKVQRTSLLNRGGYGEVYRGTYHGEIVAIKMLLPAHRRDMRQINSFLAEVKLMAAMEHERVVRFIGVAWDSLSDLCAVSEFMEGGDLRTLLTHFEAKERRPRGFDRDKARIALHVMHALTYLHSLEPMVLHRDLKSKNILLTADLDAKITDFGVSRESSDVTMTAGVGTSLWMAPEVMLGERYDEKADMFSFGVVLSELDSHLLPYAMAKESVSGRVLPDTAVLQMVSLGRLRIEMSANAPQAVVELAYQCVEIEPEKRPTAVEALYKLQQILKMHEDFVL